MSSIKRLVPLNALELSSNPANGKIGDLYYNTLEQKLKVFNGTLWVPVSEGSSTPNSLSIQQVNASGNVVENYEEITAVQFDEDSGFDVTNPSPGIAKIAMNSTFKFWEIDGVPTLTAQGLDTVNLISGNGINISGSPTPGDQSVTIDIDDSIIATKSYSDLNRTTISNNPPSTAQVGQSWLESDTGNFYIYDGEFWVGV
jgi:hypothetical protein